MQSEDEIFSVFGNFMIVVLICMFQDRFALKVMLLHCYLLCFSYSI